MSYGDLLDKRIRRKLYRLRSALRSRLAGEGLAWLTVALVALVFVTLAFDYWLHMDRIQRTVIMALALCGVGWICWRHLARPMLVPMGQEDLALLVERRFSQLGDRLVGAVSFSESPSSAALASEAMIAHMARQANELAGLLDFGEVVERRKIWRAVGLAAAAAVLLGGFSIWQSPVMAMWFQRNVTIWSDAQWPQKTVLTIDPGQLGHDFQVVRGQDLTVTVRVRPGSEVTPQEVVFHAWYPSAGMTEARVSLTDVNTKTYVKVFRAVAEPFEFYVTGGDDKRDKRRPHKVIVLDPPVLRDVQFLVEYPAYMDQKEPRPCAGALGSLSAPVGSTVGVTARCTKNIEWARIYLDDEPVGKVNIIDAEVEGSGPLPRRIVGRFQVKFKAPEQKKAQRVRARELRLAIRDTDNISNNEAGQFLLQILPDQDPKISLKKKGVGGSVTPNATIPLDIHATDDCGISALLTNIKVKPGNGPNIPDKPIKLAPGQVGKKDVHKEHKLELAGRFKPKMSIQVRVRAEDTLPKDEQWGGPNSATSGVLDFRIVRPEELMAQLVRRQKELRLEFVRTIAMQASARAKTLFVIQAVASGTIPPDARRGLTESSGLEISVGSECAKAAMTLQNILDELINNKLGTEETRTQLENRVIDPLRELAEPLQTTAAALDKMSKVDDAAELIRQADTVAQTQLKILDELKAIRDRMQKLESRQELAYKLEMIIKLWDKVLDTATKESESEVGRVLGPTTKPSDSKKDKKDDKKID